MKNRTNHLLNLSNLKNTLARNFKKTMAGAVLFGTVVTSPLSAGLPMRTGRFADTMHLIRGFTEDVTPQVNEKCHEAIKLYGDILELRLKKADKEIKGLKSDKSYESKKMIEEVITVEKKVTDCLNRTSNVIDFLIEYYSAQNNNNKELDSPEDDIIFMLLEFKKMIRNIGVTSSEELNTQLSLRLGELKRAMKKAYKKRGIIDGNIAEDLLMTEYASYSRNPDVMEDKYLYLIDDGSNTIKRDTYKTEDYDGLLSHLRGWPDGDFLDIWTSRLNDHINNIVDIMTDDLGELPVRTAVVALFVDLPIVKERLNDLEKKYSQYKESIKPMVNQQQDQQQVGQEMAMN